MTTLNGELLSLYNNCRTLALDCFQVAVFDHLKALIPFDSGRLIGVDTANGGAEVRSALIHREPETMNLQWEEVARFDTVLATVSAAPGRSCNFNARVLFAAPLRAVVLDYTLRFQHMNGLVIATTNATPGHLEGLSLYRCRDEHQFTREEQAIIEAFAPHVQQALQINRALAQGNDPALPFAVVSNAGMLNFCTPQLDNYIRSEFPQWRGWHLPDELLRALEKDGFFNLRTLPLRLTVQRFDGIWLMRACQVEPSGLTPRESAAALLFIQGHSHKEVARHLGVAPSTVRNFLQRVYQKLDVHDKASLALRLTAQHATG